MDEEPRQETSHDAPAESPTTQQHDDSQPPPTPQSSFRPIFTVIKDTNTSRYHHPDVRYIFSDDDTDAITDAALRSLQAEHYESEPTEHTTPTRRKDGNNKKKQQTPVLEPPERYIVVDLQPATEPEQDAPSVATERPPNVESPSPAAVQQRNQDFKVVSANSMNPSWAVLDAKLSPAPTFDSSSNSPPSTQEERSPVGGLMLKIEGTSGFDISSVTGARQQQTQLPQGRTMDEMLEQFHRRMEELRLVVDAGGQHSQDQQEDDDEKDKDETGKGKEQEETKGK